MLLLLAITSIAESNASPFRKLDTLLVLPSGAESASWHNPGAALSQDVDETGIYQSFNQENSAYFDGRIPVRVEEMETAPFPTEPPEGGGSEADVPALEETLETEELPEDASAIELIETEQSEEGAPEAIENPAPFESVPEATPSEPEPSQGTESEDTPLEALSKSFFRFALRATTLLPFASETITEPLLESIEPVAEATEENAPETFQDQEPAVSEPDPVTELAPPLEEQPTETDNTAPASGSTTPEISEEQAPTPEEDATTETAVTFSDFSLPKLNSGQLLRNVQLRISLGGSIREVLPSIPSVNVEYSLGEEWTSAGSILLDGEVSNALNGGYFLFALPRFKKVEELDALQVRLSYVGETDALESVYVDALWLQVDTETFDRDVLKERLLAKNLPHLRMPTMYDFVSSDLDFTMDELPKFSLKYKSQRNAAVRFIRDLLGRDLAHVAEVRTIHRDLGPLPLSPIVDVTPDGLITMQLRESDKNVLRPGEYEVSITVMEGNKAFTDTFSFQWGLLSVNSSQTEYELGQTAEISLAALTRNGNTLCDADLVLYLIDPTDYVTDVEVIPSGFCTGNNVTDVPDYAAVFTPTATGTHTMYVERLGEAGEVLSHTEDTFIVKDTHPVSVRRSGPSRIYPPSPYTMTLSVTPDTAFLGTLVERVPRSFTIVSTDATVRETSEFYELEWQVNAAAGEIKNFTYEFDAPDLSPYLYRLGPAELSSEEFIYTAASGTTSGTSSPASLEETAGSYSFTEHRAWQVASDATGNMILFWDNANGIPSGWTCVSCTSGDTFFQRFIVGSSTYNATGGTSTHSHNASSSVLATSNATTENIAGGTIDTVSHTHSLTSTVSAESNLPAYRQLRVIQYTASAGEPASIPTGAIGMFDGTIPTGWTQYNDQNGRYIYGEDTPSTTGGSNTHTHSVTGTTGAGAGTTVGNRGPDAADGAAAGHTHTISTSTPSVSSEPPYITVMLAKIDATSTAPNGLIALWTEDVPAAWLDVSSDPADPFSGKFLKATSTYGSTGGASTHTHADMNSIVSSGPNTTVTLARAASTGAGSAHTHSVNVTNFTTTSNLPSFVTAVVGKRQGNNPVFTQHSYRWYANANAQTPTDPWPSGGTNLAEREAISGTSTPLEFGDVIRLRLSAQVENATATASTSLKLQYGSTTSSCSAITSWFDVGAATSSAEWRGFNNASVTDHSTLSSTTLASTTVAETYEENGYTAAFPNNVPIDGVAEWDFVLEQNGASAGSIHCFRMVQTDGSALHSYDAYPQLLTNSAPVAPTLSKLFDNEKVASTTPWFEFVTTDPESQDLNYQIQIDNDPDFSSAVVDHDTENNGDFFENLVVPADKDPFTSGQLMRYQTQSALTNGITYWWRVRARDPQGSNRWGAWATARSFTIDTSLTASAWYQTTEAQFDTSSLVNLDAVGSNQVQLASGSTTGTYTSDVIDFDDGTLGTAWDSLAWNDTETSGDIKYSIEYQNTQDQWGLIPESVLPGNSAGFDSSSVSLLDLDTDTYNEIRIVADFTDSGGSPSLQDITINWGYRVETPSISRLFPNEKTGTTTPTLEFTTTDPQSDSLTYQVSWSTDNTFTSSTTRTSDTHAGFVNADSGGDLDPFNSGNTIQFTVQPGDALTNNATYWWRVRAKDTTGDDAYSLWTEPRSFTVDTTVTVSTWFQTTEEQFDTDILSGTVPLTSDVVAVATTAREAMLVYGEGVESAPRYREWDGSAWGSEGTLLDIGAPLKWAVVRAGTTREEYVAATLGTDADINVQVFTLGEWNDLTEVTTSVTDISARGFDVTYETLSGNAMVAYCDGDADPSFYTWNGSTWTSGGTINLASTNNCAWIRLASDPVSNEAIILARDTAGAYEAQVWNGSSWGNSTTQGSITEAAHEGMAVEYEESGGQAVIVTSDGNPARFRYNIWNGTSWAGAATQALGNDFEWGELVRDDGSDELALCYVDDDVDVGMVEWTGSGWSGQTELDADGNAKTDPPFSCVYETTSGRDNYIMTAYSDTAATNYSFWNNTTWSTEAQINSIGDAATMKLIRTGVGSILGLFFDDPNDDLLASSWNGSSWSTTTVIESNASVDTSPFGHPYALTPRNDGREGTVIVSPGIAFSDGVGPYWFSMSWIDSTPGASDILYSVQYFDTASSSWKFIPNSDLPGNESGTTTSPIDLTGLNVNTYNLIRPYALLSCDGSTNCPTLSDWTLTWAEGITVSGTMHEYDQTSSSTSGTIAVAVNGVLQVGKTSSVINGSWSIGNVTVFPGDIVTVFASGAGDPDEAVGVTRYDGIGNITAFSLYKRHLVLGSDDATTTPLTNAQIGLYDFTNDEDLFHNATGTSLSVCVEAGCADAELTIKAGIRYQPSGSLVTHDLENNGTLLAEGNTLTLSGSWDNNATATMATSTVIFSATSTNESIDGTGSVMNSFYNITFGTATNTALWTLVTPLDADNNLSVSFGTLARNSQPITIGGNLSNGAAGFWTGIGTTTFDGAVARTWSDVNSSLQNVGRVVVDGTSKTVQLAGNVRAESIHIGADDTLDATTANFDITVMNDWINVGTFVARQGEVIMAATTTNRTVTAGSDSFYDLTFSGAGGAWSFSEALLSIGNDIRIATGTVTLPTGTSTVTGTWNTVGGTFAHNNSTVVFNSGSAETIAASGTPFTNNFHTLVMSGTGSWTFLDTHATTSSDLRVQNGSVTFPSGTLSVGGHFANSAGAFAHNSGTVRFTGSGAQTIDTNASFNHLSFAGSGSTSFIDSSVTVLGNFSVENGTTTLPSGTLSLGGSLTNAATLSHNNGTVFFNSTDTGETIQLGSSPLRNMTLQSATGGWTISSSATTTGAFTLASSSSFALASGQTLAVGGVFTNSVGGASTTWTGSTLSLEAGGYSVNTKTNQGDSYETLRIKANTDIKLWNSSASSYTVDPTGSLYSQDHAAVDGDLYIFGAYERTSGNEYWSYATDFDGAALGTSTSRQVDVRFASDASASLVGGIFEVLGSTTATTTIANQGSGAYAIYATTSTSTLTYYDFDDLGASGVSLGGAGRVTSLADGSFEPSVSGGTGLSVSSSTIDANPGLQIYRVEFSTSTAISASNVTQTGGAPSSYWWFRESLGNLDGEAFDNDTGDPGSIRWDDSSLSITISGTVYEDDGVTPMGAPVCDGSSQTIRVVVEGGPSYTGSCAGGNGTFSIPGIVIVGDPVLSVYLDTNGGPRGVVVTKTPTGDIADFDIYVNRVTTRHEDVSPLSILDMAFYDQDDDTDISYRAATGTLTVFSNTELHVASSTTFAPDGAITIEGNASTSPADGSLHIDDNAMLIGSGTSTITVGGSFTMDTGAVFTPASTTVVMTASTTGKTITTPSPQEIAFNELSFTGAGGGWNINGDIRAQGSISVSTGTVTGTGDITVVNGSFSGNGTVSLGGGQATLERGGTLGGTTAWTFYDLVLGNGSTVGTTTPGGATTTVLGGLTIEVAHFLNAQNSIWNLAGAGNTFVENGTFLEGTSTVRYSGTSGANVLSTTYYHLDLKAQGGSPTYTATGLGIIVAGNLTVGGPTTTTFTLDANDPALDVNGNIIIEMTGTLVGSGSGSFTVGGDWDNNGTYTGSGGTVTFDGSGSPIVSAGTSLFSSVLVNGSGSFTFSESATATAAFTLSGSGSFIQASGTALAVGGTFGNGTGGGATTWNGSTLFLYGGGNYAINASTTSDTYERLSVAVNTQIRMWNSSANAYDVSGSLYSQDHASANGDLYIFGAYSKTAGTDHWSYAIDFDGTDISASPRNVDVYVAGGTSILYTGGGLSVVGVPSATTTIQNQGSGTYAFRIGGTTSTTLSYYQVRNTDSAGLTLSGTPNVVSISNGDFEVGINSGSAITVGGTVINQNQAKTFTQNRFATSTGVSPATNVTATGTTVSSWRFTNHAGTIDGEAFDSDPGGDPGYIVWDDSAALITVAGTVYSDEGTTLSSVCDGSTLNIHLRVAGLTSYTTSCSIASSTYSIPNVAYSPGDSFVVYIDGETEKAATVSEDPISSIGNMDLYENRVIARHEGSDPLSIADMAFWDSSDDADIPFTAVNASPDTLTLPADRKLIVWTSKEFEPQGNVTLQGGGGGAAYDGTLELYANATFDATGGESHSVGGSFLTGSGSVFDDETSTFTFTTAGANRTIDTNEYPFYNLSMTGSGSWTIANAALSVGNDFTITQGVVTLPAGTTTVTGSLVAADGSFIASGGTMLFNSAGSEIVQPGSSSFGVLALDGTGSFTMIGANATATSHVHVLSGSFTSATGTLAVGGNFINNGTFVHANGTLRLTSSTSTLVTASSSDLGSVTFAGPGTFTFTDLNLTLQGSLRIEQGHTNLASGTLSIGGSFVNSGGTFTHASGTILFNSSDTGETVDPGGSIWSAVTFAGAGGGWTISGNATATRNFSLVSAANFTLASSTTLSVGGVFTNLVGGGATTWTGSTLRINSGTSYTINTKSVGGDTYGNMHIGSSTDLRAWDSAGSVTMLDGNSSLYSQDHAGVSGALYIFGNYRRTTGADYWSYATDFDGASLGTTTRQAFVYFANGATTTFSGGALNIVGANGFDTTISNQGSGTYALRILGGTLNALYFDLSNMDADGLTLSGTTSVTSLSEGNFTLAVNGGSLITLSSTTLNHNAGLVLVNASFATTSAVTGFNVELVGTTPSAWTFTNHTGNFDGEDFDFDGGDACGSIRWDDSLCLLSQQSAYRWRSDDGGEGVPNSEWLDQNWTKRMRVTLTNLDAVSYADAVIKLTVPYDADMQGDFDDLRFTHASGTTQIPHFTETFTASTEATVWVKVPLLATSTETEIYMYYGNGGAADGSATSTFLMIDNFEDGNITEYSGDTGEFAVSNSAAYERTFKLVASDPNNGKTDLGGMYNQSYSVTQGQTLRYLQYVDSTATSDETCTAFATQSQTQNYAVCLELFGVDRMSLARNVLHRDTSGTVLSSTTVTYSTGWYEVEIDWSTDDSIFVSLYQNDTLVATTSANDGTYTSGGIGYTLWTNHGAWDMYTARSLLATEPGVSFGGEQVPGGASWYAGLNTVASGVEVGDTVRVRFLVENTGLAVTDQNYELEFAPKDTAPSCEAVDYDDYVEVPNAGSCGTSALCMETSTFITNLASTTDLIGGDGAFTAGQIVESPSNNTGNITVENGEYTELEYVIAATENVIDSNYCFRVTNEGTDLDSYSRVAELAVLFAPNITALSLNGGMDITLTGGATTTVYATGTVSDLNGYTDLAGATSTIFRSGVGESCSLDNNSCYISGAQLCSFVNCSGITCDVECSADLYYHADPTDIGTFAGETWRALLTVTDLGGSVATATAPSIDLLTLRAIAVDSVIDYGSLAPNSDTGSYNATTTVENIGNDSLDIAVEGTDLTDGGSSAIPVSGQRFATSSFTYSACTFCSSLSASSTNYELDLSKPTTTAPAIVDELFWGIAIPFGVAGAPHSGTNIFYAIGD